MVHTFKHVEKKIPSFTEWKSYCCTKRNIRYLFYVTPQYWKWINFIKFLSELNTITNTFFAQK
jgi:hypothetical protein